MNASPSSHAPGSPAADAAARATAALALKPDGIIEAIARDAGLSPRQVLESLPAGQAAFIAGDRFDEVWRALGRWREVLLIVQTGDVVLEVRGPLPPGTEGGGWFNVHGDGPIGGHIRKAACTRIAFVDRLFHGRRSSSVWFMDEAGAALFKVFVPRDAARTLDPEALSAFEALRAALCASR